MSLLKKEVRIEELIDILSSTEGIELNRGEILNNGREIPVGTFDVVIVCALPEEKDRTFDAFEVSEAKRNKLHYDYRADYSFVFHSFSFAGHNIALVTQNAMGIATATSLTTRAILAMKPKIVAMTGICAGRKGKTGLGDIVVAEQVYDYTAGKKYTDRFAPRPHPISLENDFCDILSAKVLNNDLISDSISQSWSGPRISRRISIHMKTIASGTSVIDDEETVLSAAAIQDNLYAIDMESYGFALAAHALHTKWIVIKAVQDFADGKKENDEKGIRDFSSYASAALLKCILLDLLNEGKENGAM